MALTPRGGNASSPGNGMTGVPVTPRPSPLSPGHGIVASPRGAPNLLRPCSLRPAMRSHTVVNLQFVDGGDVSDASSKEDEEVKAKHQLRRAKTLGAQASASVSIAVVAPGGGTGINSTVYSTLARKDDFAVDILGKSGATYDRYPPAWAKEGAAAPNLESFALDLLSQGRINEMDCLVVGSRGGQVVLPTLWKVCGEEVPPAVVMNGGCAMSLPIQVHWPESAVSFLLIGGKDYFRGRMDNDEYLSNAQHHVPEGNATTAILLVHEMQHMPQSELLMATLQHMIRAATSWKATGVLPADGFGAILDNLRRGGWHGKLTYKIDQGESWKTEVFP